MSKRFQPNRRLLQLLVGSNLYGSPDACIRELVQNSWDAIQLRKHIGDGDGGQIHLRYSIRDRWFEVIDDGIGMDSHTIENSFLEIGQDKLDVIGRGERDMQIGYFGIGILSIFLVADKFEVGTKQFDSEQPGICFEIAGIDESMKLLDNPYDTIGTYVRVFLRPDGNFNVSSIPDYLSNYARHVDGIIIESVDDNQIFPLLPRWATDGYDNVRDGYNLPGASSLRFAFSTALRKNSGALASEITICNAGFLAETAARDLLPLPSVGLVGEIDLLPNTLTMSMSRERIQRDQAWTELGMQLQDAFIKFALEELSSGELRHDSSLDVSEIKRNLFLWYKFLPAEDPFSSLYSLLERRIFSTIPFPSQGRRPMTLEHLLARGRNADKLYFRDISKSAQHTERIDDDGLPIRISQEMRDSIRVSALRARGFDVIELATLSVNVHNGNSVQTVQITEQELVSRCLERNNGRLVNIVQAPESDMDLASIDRLPILKDALSVGAGFRFVSVPDSTRRVITDSTGAKYINLRNGEVQEILELIPGSISNPLRSRLLDAYLNLELYQLASARGILRDLLAEDDLAALASAETASFTGCKSEIAIGTV